MRLDRSLIGRSVRFTEISGESFDYEQFLHCIDQWKAQLAPQIAAGERVAFFSTTTTASLALAFALWELGISYFGDEVRARVIQRAISLKVKCLFVDDMLYHDAEQEARGEIELVRIPGAAEMLGQNFKAEPLFRPYPTEEAIIGFTSGSTGDAKFVSHTHDSLWAPSVYMAAQHYSATDEVLIYINLNHLGFVSCILLAAMRAGCGLHLLPSSNPDYVVPAIKGGKINVCPLFPYNWYHIKSNFPEISLQGINKVITGGTLISQDFCQSLFAKGAGQVLNVYGLTEALPPVSIKAINPENLSAYSGLSVGQLAPYMEVQIRDGEIFVRGDNVGKIQGAGSEDGFIPTGDHGDLLGGELHIFSRKKLMIIAGGQEITADDVLWFVRGLDLNGKKLGDWIGPGQSAVTVVGNRLILAIEREDRLPIDLGWLNAQLQSGLRPELKIEQILYFEKLPFNGLKVDGEGIRRRLLAPAYLPLGDLPRAASPSFLRWQFGDSPESTPVAARSANFHLWFETAPPAPGGFREEMINAVRALDRKRGKRTVALCYSGGAHAEAVARCLEQESIPYEAFFLDIYGQNTLKAEPWLNQFEQRTGKTVKRISLSRDHFLHHHAPNGLIQLGCDQPTALALTYLFEQIPDDMFIVAGGGHLTRKGGLIEKIAHRRPIKNPALPTPYSQVVHYLWSYQHRREGEFYFYSSTPALLAATLRDPNFSWQSPFSDSMEILHAHFPEITRRPPTTNWDTIAAEQEDIFIRQWLRDIARDREDMQFWKPDLGAMLNVEPLLRN